VSPKLTSRLALGTVQFGLRYGIANRTGRVSRDDAAAIVAHARAAGWDTLDTAAAYGDCEKRLGEIGVAPWRVVSKLPPTPGQVGDIAKWVHESVRQSLQCLRIPKLYALLVHHSQALLCTSGEALFEAMLGVKEAGWVEKIGVSIYGPAELDALWPNFQFDIIQGPFNIVDQRLATSGWLRRLRASGTEIHTRSAFLQGLLLMPRAERPPQFDRWRSLWDKWESWLDECNLTALQACLGFAMSHDEIDRIIIGVDSTLQLHAIIAGSAAASISPPEWLSSDDPNLVDPTRWGKS
jgi:aryl-alcohol dehydrogenase-like predicted oxidoreductase